MSYGNSFCYTDRFWLTQVTCDQTITINSIKDCSNLGWGTGLENCDWYYDGFFNLK